MSSKLTKKWKPLGSCNTSFSFIQKQDLKVSGMLVGVCQIELFVPDSSSLKSKRCVLSSIKKRIRNKFNVSVSEIDSHNKWQRITLGISMISNERRYIDMTIGEILNVIEGDGRMELINHFTEVY